MLIIVEGHTDKDFIELYCKYLCVEVKSDQICQTDGKDNIKNVKEKIHKALVWTERY